MEIILTEMPGLLIFEPKRFGDQRGFFTELFNSRRYADCGISTSFVQDNMARSSRSVLRGLHLQNPNMQAKLVSVLRGAVLDVAVDVRVGSPTFGRHVAVELSDDNGRQFYVPRGFAHGYAVLSETADFFYKCDAFYSPKHEMVVRWDDPALKIDWRLSNPTLTPRDAEAPLLADVSGLPAYER
ncbi:MAG: dTDP-4-dehydrorhamnose 3,5-epimerase [Xanthobacteraceae bacterium]|nr:dTDP-4-dehydrorhamnose 3,5-epimerase [Xanthobacteraceae bacterium]